MESKISAAELKMKELLKECEDIIDDNYLTTQDARRIMDSGYKIVMKCEELRTSRDKAITRRDIAEKKLKSLNMESANISQFDKNLPLACIDPEDENLEVEA